MQNFGTAIQKLNTGTQKWRKGIHKTTSLTVDPALSGLQNDFYPKT
jgi:hypothetical protein